MLALPHRDSFLCSVSGSSDPREGLRLLQEWLSYVDPLKRSMWAYFQHRGIEVIE